MVAKVFKDVSEVIDDYTGFSRLVLEYVIATKEMNKQCKQPGFRDEEWDQFFARFFDTGNFQRVGHLKEVMDYPTYLKFQTQWAPMTEWEGSFKRITESDNVVILELEERVTVGDYKNVVNTISVYEFNETGRVYRLDVYLQQAPQSTDEVPDGYKDIAK